MNKKFSKIYPYIFSIAFIYFTIIAAFIIICLIDKGALYNLIIKNETTKFLPFPISDQDLKTLCNELIDYLRGSLTFLETKININGTIQEFYSIRSKIHMADVRNLFKNFTLSCYFSIVVCIFSLFKIINIENGIVVLKNAWLKTCKIFGIIFVTLIIFAITNFDTFFIKFHELLFNNDLWLLDPREDYIICLLPENIFMVYGIKIAITIVITLIVVFLCLHLLSKIQHTPEAK